MSGETRLAELDDRFVRIYEATRRRLLDEQKARALIVVSEDSLLLYRGGGTPRVIAGLRPPLYEKLKALSHVPLAIYCLLTGETDGGRALAPSVSRDLSEYRQELGAAAAEFDTTEEFEAGVLPHRLAMFDRSLAFLDRVLADGRVSERTWPRSAAPTSPT